MDRFLLPRERCYPLVKLPSRVKVSKGAPVEVGNNSDEVPGKEERRKRGVLNSGSRERLLEGHVLQVQSPTKDPLD